MSDVFKPFVVSGITLHSGETTTVRVSPAGEEEGYYFVRVDLPGKPIIKANVQSVVSTTLSTELGEGEAKIRTVEHLLAALWGCGVKGARIEVEGGEIPLLDGSALVWVEKLNLTNPFPPKSSIAIKEPIWVGRGDSFCMALPCEEMRFTYGIDFPYPVLQNQWYTWYPQRESFQSAIAPARTFGFADQVSKLRDRGLIKGGSLDNALVCDGNGWLNPPLRFDNEAVRHKLLDFIGDLSLLKDIPTGHYIAYKASHQLHWELAKKIALYCLNSPLMMK